MSFLFKNYSLVKVLYLLVICYKARFFLWNTNNTDKNGVNKHTHTHTHTPEFNLSFLVAFVKSYPFATVGLKRMKICSPTNCLIPWVSKFPTVLKTILLSETIVSQAELAFIHSEFSNNSRIRCKISLKLTTEAPDIVLLSL